MMTMMVLLVFLLVIINFGLFYLQHNSITKERELWHQERNDLYNRIHASNYVEYKSLEIKQKEKKEEEPPIEYV